MNQNVFPHHRRIELGVMRTLGLLANSIFHRLLESVYEDLVELIRYMPNMEGIRSWLYSKLLKRMGKNVHISECVIIDHPSMVELGDDVSINPFSYIQGEGGITIGNNVRISFHTCIITVDHVYQDLTIPIWEQGLMKKKRDNRR